MVTAKADIFDNGEDIDVEGAESTHSGKIYTREIVADYLPKKAIVGFTNSLKNKNNWDHNFQEIYQTTEVSEAVQKFKESTVSNLIIIDTDVPQFGKIDRLDDLQKKYLV